MHAPSEKGGRMRGEETDCLSLSFLWYIVCSLFSFRVEDGTSRAGGFSDVLVQTRGYPLNPFRRVRVARKRFREGEDKMLENEVLALSRLSSCQGVVRFLWRDGMDVFLEAAEGDLFDLISSSPLSEEEAAKTGEGVREALLHIHFFGVAHMDVKPENVLLFGTKERRVVKLCDFNLSFVDPPPVAKGGKGSRSYSAPEVFGEGGFDPFAADAWSLGVLVFASLTGVLPFSNTETCPRYASFRRRGSFLSHPCGEVLEKKIVSLLSTDPGERLSKLRGESFLP